MDGLNIQDDSWAEVTIGSVTKRIDLYRAYNEFADFDRQAREECPGDDQQARRQVVYIQKVVAYLHGLGFEGVGDRAADRFDAALAKEVDRMGKADASAPTPA